MAELSNLLPFYFTTLDYISSPIASGVTETTLKLDLAAYGLGDIDWAVWEDGASPDIVDLAAIKAHTGAEDFGTQAVVSTGAQDQIDVVVEDTTKSVYHWYVVWSDGTNESIVYTGAFGVVADELSGIVGAVVGSIVGSITKHRG